MAATNITSVRSPKIAMPKRMQGSMDIQMAR